MSSKKNIPAIRFSGFSGEWEDFPFHNKVDFFSGLTYSPESVVDYPDTLVLRSSNVKNGEISLLDNVYVKSDVVNVDNVKQGDIIVVVRNGSRELIGKHALISLDMPKTVIGAFMTGIRTSQFTFTNALLDTILFKKEVDKSLGATINQITMSGFKGMNYFFPKDAEQQQIGNYFQNIDKLINQSSSKLEKLKSLKKAYIEKMFPKHNSTTPEVRFKGFSGEWQERTLGYFGDVAMNKRIFKYQTLSSGDVPFYKIGTFGSTADAFITRDVFDDYKQKYPYPTKGDILISASGSIGRTVEYYGQDAYFQDSNIVWLNHRNKLDNTFLKYFYDVVKWYGIEGSTIKRLYNSNILNTIIFVPSREEQKKIGNFFRNLDEQIATQEKKLTKLKNIKKACLEKMFV